MKMNQELKDLQTFTVEEFQSDFENLISRVENGESFLIQDGNRRALLVPFKETIRFALDSLKPTVDEELIQIHRDHEEGS
jgi:antitoxin (DNA-binding transcriptional repressor) of toxin-antitoxin stability system